MTVEVRRIDPAESRAFGASVLVPFLDAGNTDGLDHWTTHLEGPEVTAPRRHGGRVMCAGERAGERPDVSVKRRPRGRVGPPA